MNSIKAEAEYLVHTSVDDAASSAPHYSVAVLKWAIRIEESAKLPRIELIRRLKAEIRKKERAAWHAAKDSA
jgi:hypothetical protein